MDHTDNKILARILKKVLTPEQITQLLQEITFEIVDGFCPLCEHEEMPVDKDGHEIEGDDVSHAEWRELHYENCLVSLLEKAEATAQ